MEKSAFRAKLLRYIDEKINDDSVDDEQTFSEFWEAVRDHVDENADNEDIEELSDDDDDAPAEIDEVEDL